MSQRFVGVPQSIFNVHYTQTSGEVRLSTALSFGGTGRKFGKARGNCRLKIGNNTGGFFTKGICTSQQDSILTKGIHIGNSG